MQMDLAFSAEQIYLESTLVSIWRYSYGTLWIVVLSLPFLSQSSAADGDFPNIQSCQFSMYEVVQ